MEKIYEENGKKKQSFFQQFFNDKGSMVAVIVVAIVAVVGLIAFGFNQISFAADEEMGDQGVPVLVDSFTSVYGNEGDQIRGAGGTTETGEIPGISFIPYQRDTDGNYVICVDYMVPYAAGEKYYSSSEVDDAGLVYLMTELDKALASADPELAYWLKQTAVWAYLYNFENEAELVAKDPTKAASYKNIHDNVKYVNILYDSSNQELHRSPSGLFWNDYGIQAIYNNAVNGTFSSSSSSYDIDLTRDNDKMSLSGDGKYYVTSNYSVTSKNSGMFNHYYVELSGDVPEGTKVYRENGTIHDINEELPSTAKFKLMIPVDKVNDKNKNFNVLVYSDYEGEGLVYYTNPNERQTVVDKGPIYEVAEDSIAVKVNYTPNVPDTGMTTAQTIYFIGLIILLSGVGIIYAIAKPQENN